MKEIIYLNESNLISSLKS